MKVSGFTFVRNGVKFDYPFLESLDSLLPLCDEVVIAVGKSEDATLQLLREKNSPKIKIIETEWDESLRKGGAILAQQTDVALSGTSGTWALYLQGDEILHEEDYPAIREAMSKYGDDLSVEGLLFHYTHFFGSYSMIGASRKWYRREVRIIRNGIGVTSWGDAQGFRINGRKLRVKQIPARIYHYGWVKPPEIQQLKQKTFNKLWHSDEWVKEHVGDAAVYDYSTGGRLVPFTGTHPVVMKDRVGSMNWKFSYDPAKSVQPLRQYLLDRIEDVTGWRIGEYRNYDLL